MRRPLAVIGVASGAGAGTPGCADAPDSLRALCLLADLERLPGRVRWEAPLRPADTGDRLTRVAEICTRLAARVQAALGRGDFPLVIGGDHSIAAGTWSGVRGSLAPADRLGLVWLDAHLDSHTFATSPSRNIHGMPLACLLGHGDPALTGIAGPPPKLRPEDVCIVGARSFEPAEFALLQDLGVRIYLMPEIRERGVAAVMAEAITRATRRTAGFGISFDVDVFDPGEEAGTGLPVAGGLFRTELLSALAPCRGDRRLLALEIVEYDPHRDPGMATAGAIRDLCLALL